LLNPTSLNAASPPSPPLTAINCYPINVTASAAAPFATHKLIREERTIVVRRRLPAKWLLLNCLWLSPSNHPQPRHQISLI